MKKTYKSPELVVRGTIEEITQGSSWGISDLFVGDGTVTGEGCQITGLGCGS